MENVKLKLDNDYIIDLSRKNGWAKGRHGSRVIETKSVEQISMITENGDLVSLSVKDIIELAKKINDWGSNTLPAIPL